MGKTINESFGIVIKSLGLEFNDDYGNICDKIIDYMELVREYDSIKRFVFVNLRSYISDKDCIMLYDTILRKQFMTIMLGISCSILARLRYTQFGAILQGNN